MLLARIGTEQGRIILGIYKLTIAHISLIFFWFKIESHWTCLNHMAVMNQSLLMINKNVTFTFARFCKINNLAGNIYKQNCLTCMYSIVWYPGYLKYIHFSKFCRRMLFTEKMLYLLKAILNIIKYIAHHQMSQETNHI